MSAATGPALVRTYHCTEVTSRGGLVTGPEAHVAEAGAEMLAQGGNAVDAAVAAAFVDGVVEPQMSGLGGGVTMTIALREPARTAVIEGHMVSPMAASPDHFPIAEQQPDGSAVEGGWSVSFFDQPVVEGFVNVVGAKAVAVPGAVAALLAAHERFGRLSRDAVVAPAIRLAADGFRVSWFFAACVASDVRNLLRDPGCADLFFYKGAPLRGPLDRPGARFKQPKLARTLELIAADGADAFYRGEIAASVVHTIAEQGGLVTADDMATYEPTIVEPALELPYGDLRLLGSPTAGFPTVAQALYLYELAIGGDVGPTPASACNDAVAWARALKLAFQDRHRYMTADPTVSVPWEGLRSIGYSRARHAAELAGEPAPDPSRFSREPVPTPRPDGAPGQGGHTSQIAAVDADGNIVTLTATTLAEFGARVLDPETGVLLNNGMAYFDPRPDVANAIRPGVQVLSAMSPLVMVHPERGPFAGVGASGGRRIVSGVAQIVAAVARGTSLQDAVEQPRIHAESDTVLLETTWPKASADALEAAGYRVERVVEEPTTVHFARPNGVLIDADGTRRSGVDPRKPGGAATA